MQFILRNNEILGKAIAYIASLPQDKLFQVKIEEYKSTRSSAQNRIFHKWVGIMSQETGYHAEEMKDLLKREILGVIEYKNKKTGDIVERVQSTAELNVEEFSRLISETDILAAKMGMSLPREDYSLAMGIK